MKTKLIPAWAGNTIRRLALAGLLAGAPAAAQALGTALKGPHGDIEEIVFAVRLPYEDPHWYANIGYYCNDERQKAWAGNGKPDAGRLCILNLKTGGVTCLVDAPGGSVRDPQVHYDARKILFSFRAPGTEHYHLYEINRDGTGQQQLTRGEVDDYEPIYLPDGGLLFVSTRCNRWVNCWKTQVGIMYRCDADGGQIRQVSANTEHDNTPWMMPDGRVLYTRWEYVDRSQVDFHHLWTMNPDGTQQAIYYGNQHPGIVMIDAKPAPGSTRVMANFSPGHGASDHAGIATLVSNHQGPDDRTMARPLHRGSWIMDPYPLAADSFLAARGNQICWYHGGSEATVLLTYTNGPGGVHEPRPLVARPREPVIQARAKPGSATGQMILTDVYQSRGLEGVKRGEITKLLVLESLPKPVNFSGGPDLVSWLGTFTLERVLGTVPVEPDGSAYFEVPANRQVFFVALDQKEAAVKRMQSFTSVAPGEVAGCAGCHERRQAAPAYPGRAAVGALRRAPSAIEPFAGFPDVVDFGRDIQPILDRHCAGCHDSRRREGGVRLSSGLGPHWSVSYFQLLAWGQVADGRNGLGGQPVRSLGAGASPLLAKGAGGHYGAQFSGRDWRMVWLWLESGAAYAGSYAALRNEAEQITPEAATSVVFYKHHALFKRRCGACHEVDDPDREEGRPLPYIPKFKGPRPGIKQPIAYYERQVLKNDPHQRFSPNVLLDFTHPEESSLLLGPLAREAGGYGTCGLGWKDRQDPDYQTLLAAIRTGQALLQARPRFGAPEFRPNRQYVREMKKYGILAAAFDPERDRLDVFQTDQKYWQSLWACSVPEEAGR